MNHYSSSFTALHTLPAGPKFAVRFLHLFVRLFVCVSGIIMCAIIMSHVLLPCDITLVDLTAALSTGVATMSTLAQLQVQERRQLTHKDAREYLSGLECSEAVFICLARCQVKG